MDRTSLSLLEDLRARPDEASWQRLVALYEPWIRGWLKRQNRQAADVDNLVQEVRAVLVRKIPTFRHNGRPGAFRTWRHPSSRWRFGHCRFGTTPHPDLGLQVGAVATGGHTVADLLNRVDKDH